MSYILFIVFACFLWAIDLYLRHPISQKISAIQILVLESGLAFLILTPFILYKFLPEFKKISRKDLLGFFVLGVLGSSVGSYFLTQSISEVGMDTYAFIQVIQPLFVSLLAVKFLKEKFDTLDIFWFFWVIFSAALINYTDFEIGTFFDAAKSNPKALFYSLVAALIWGSCTIYGKFLLKTFSPFFLTYMRWGFATFSGFIFFLYKGETLNLTSLNSSDWFSVVGISLFTGFFSMVLYYKGLKYLKASSAAYLELTYPAFSILISSIMIYEQQSIYQIIGVISLGTVITIKLIFSERKLIKSNSIFMV